MKWLSYRPGPGRVLGSLVVTSLSQGAEVVYKGPDVPARQEMSPSRLPVGGGGGGPLGTALLGSLAPPPPRLPRRDHELRPRPPLPGLRLRRPAGLRGGAVVAALGAQGEPPLGLDGGGPAAASSGPGRRRPRLLLLLLLLLLLVVVVYRRLLAPRSSLDPLEVLLGGGGSGAPSSALRNELKIVRTSEKEQLQGLNDRFVTYIEKVHQLEQHNRLLEAEVAALRGRQAEEPSRLQRLYQEELRELRAQAEALRRERDAAALESQQLVGALQRLQDEAAREAQRRQEAEGALRQARKEADRAALARRDLEKKVEALADEIAFLRRVHQQEVAELQAELHQAQVSVEVEVSKPDLTEALKEIRTQYEVLSARNQQSAEEWYKSKFANFTEEVARSSDSVRQAKEEISEYRRQLQARNIEIETLRSTNESLERQLQEAEERSSQEIHSLQDTISQLENALRTTKGEMARHLREYQDLLNVKMALDIEIAAYRKLLEGEETRLSTVSSCGTTLGLGYSFSSSPPLLSGWKGFSTSTAIFRKDERGEAEEGSLDPKGSEELKEAAEEDSSGDEKSEPSMAKN
ncbi:hypothetical protein JRQ81_011213 [Phrynocephalus forsythii]|uniref:IF rod domain-containing protein n=1 Tax=Phrynocephalus forsythii TaxID=171643 RepID=A0A9Q0XAY4_9SAUR|nr:hypothetical protein JRQ81_011213 [Phrynocephalus forsythii]